MLLVSAQQPQPSPGMETFFRKHFQWKAPGSGEGVRRPSGAGLPASKARRRSPAGQASSLLAQRRRSSAQLQGCLLGCGLGAWGASCRRRSSTAPPTCNPRFTVNEVPTLQSDATEAQGLCVPLLLAGLLGMKEEQEEGIKEEKVMAGASSSPPQCGTRILEPPMHQGPQRPLLHVPRCLRRASSHLFPNDVYDHTPWGLHGHYRRLSQRQPSPGGRRASGISLGPAGPPRVRPLSRRRQVALRRKAVAGPQAWSTLLA